MATPAQDGQKIDCSSGYDFNFVDSTPDRLVCKICQLPCRETQKSVCCGHVFCKRDLEKMKATTAVSYACPICRIEPFKTYPDRAVDREIKGLKIYCQNKEVGCGWSGEMDQVDAHLNKCNIPCEYCKEIVHYTAMSSHINECPCYCQHCNTAAERDVINSQHMDKCRKFPVPCPNTCGKDKIPQDEIDEHMKECPLEMVWCEYYDVGCKTKLVREKMPAHCSEAMDKHLQHVHSVVRQLKKEKESLDNAKVSTMRNRTFFFVSVIVLISAGMLFYYKASNEMITSINQRLRALYIYLRLRALYIYQRLRALYIYIFYSTSDATLSFV